MDIALSIDVAPQELQRALLRLLRGTTVSVADEWERVGQTDVRVVLSKNESEFPLGLEFSGIADSARHEVWLREIARGLSELCQCRALYTGSPMKDGYPGWCTVWDRGRAYLADHAGSLFANDEPFGPVKIERALDPQPERVAGEVLASWRIANRLLEPDHEATLARFVEAAAKLQGRGRLPALPVEIRLEEPRDADAIAQVVEAAFGRADEGRLVAALRDAGAVTLSLVAEAAGGEIVGHVLFSPVVIERSGGTSRAVGLGPLAVRPLEQRRCVGSSLVREGIDRLRRLGHEAVVVLGHPRFYLSRGFNAASFYGLRYEVAGHDESFMAIRLRPGALGQGPGVVRYRREFAGF
jgi:putative acetyltransferase